jgi:hypothetical protein
MTIGGHQQHPETEIGLGCIVATLKSLQKWGDYRWSLLFSDQYW